MTQCWYVMGQEVNVILSVISFLKRFQEGQNIQQEQMQGRLWYDPASDFLSCLQPFGAHL